MKRLALIFSLLFVTVVARADSIVLGGGCFWCMDAAFKLLPGVTRVTCGYAGGTTKYPTYRDVGTETTGHAEVVQVEFNPRKVSLQQVLQYFWECHNPTQVDGQGDDLGPSYRSIILYADDTQKAAALASRAEAQKRFSDPIATEVAPLTKFWVAEDYHQDYFDKHPDQDYCQIVIRPKVIKLQHLLGQ